MQDFNALASLAGGILIGLSAAALLLLNGRIAGISGIVSGLMTQRGPERSWRTLFVAGLLSGGLLAFAWRPELFAIEVSRSAAALVAAGLLVGFGTQLGSGCTSGHGVCGVSRLSARSLIATGTFTVTGMITVFVVEHLLGGSL